MTGEERKDLERAVEQIHLRSKEFFEPAKHGTYVCPICGSGTGKHGTGVTAGADGIHFTCWTGCFNGSDVIDIAGLMAGISPEAARSDPALFCRSVELAASRIGISYTAPAETTGHVQATKSIPAKQSTAERRDRSGGSGEATEEAADYSSFYRSAREHISETGYHRGLSDETLKRFFIGYVPDWKHPKFPPSAPATPRLIIPISRGSYLARYAGTPPESDQTAYKAKLKVGSMKNHYFNSKVLMEETELPIFVVEGEIDAMSIEDVGGRAVALGSIAMVDSFLKYLETHIPYKPLIVALDVDDNGAGQKASRQLCEGLDRMQISYLTASPQEPYKDVNELLLADRAKLKAAVEAAEEEALKLPNENDIHNGREEFSKRSAGAHLQEFIDGIQASVDTPFFSTGFENLDTLLDGGLYEGLYTVGAVTSLGKSTLVLQIADQLAQQGYDVLYISLEMARTELMSKSISRETLLEALDTGRSSRLAKTARGITTGSRYSHYSKEEKELIQSAIRRYSEYADHLYIYEGVGDVGTKEIRELMQQHFSFTGHSPILVVDYVQILQSPDSHLSDKQATDRSVLELKRISRDYKTPVIAISSFNRASYKNPVSLESFKESGALEYGSDVLIGLQQADSDAASSGGSGEAQTDIELKILKNRNGRRGTTDLFTYYKLFNYFMEVN